MPSLAGYWKFNISLLEIRDRPEFLIKRALVVPVTGNCWWVSRKHRIRVFATKSGRHLNLDRTRKAKSIEDRFSRAVAGRVLLTVELASGDLEREMSERYTGFVGRSRLKRVLKAVKLNATAREEEVQRFPGRYIDSVKSPDERVLWPNREIRDAFRVHFRDRFARCPGLQRLSCRLPPP